MSRTVWKFTFDQSWLAADLPATAKVVHAALDPATGVPTMWIELDPRRQSIRRNFRIYGTGEQIPGDGTLGTPTHVGSVIQHDYVWHIYETIADGQSERQPASANGQSSADV